MRVLLRDSAFQLVDQKKWSFFVSTIDSRLHRRYYLSASYLRSPPYHPPSSDCPLS